MADSSRKKTTTKHIVLLSGDEKRDWFARHITERHRVKPFVDQEELLKFLRNLRKAFVLIYERDVPGYFIRKVAERCGVPVEVHPKTREKMEYAWKLMDDNEHFRFNKKDLGRALAVKFGEETLHYILDDIFDDWHARPNHPSSKINIDIHGQESLFDE